MTSPQTQQTPTSQPVLQTFQDYIQHLQEWEKDLIQNIDFQHDKEDIIQTMESNAPLYFVSGGRESDRLGYFEWAQRTCKRKSKPHGTSQNRKHNDSINDVLPTLLLHASQDRTKR
eukprot:12214193-Ditylum_brightwellii.AAC.1